MTPEPNDDSPANLCAGKNPVVLSEVQERRRATRGIRCTNCGCPRCASTTPAHARTRSSASESVNAAVRQG